jgi:flagellar hook-length control protein FliK
METSVASGTPLVPALAAWSGAPGAGGPSAGRGQGFARLLEQARPQLPAAPAPGPASSGATGAEPVPAADEPLAAAEPSAGATPAPAPDDGNAKAGGDRPDAAVQATAAAAAGSASPAATEASSGLLPAPWALARTLPGQPGSESGDTPRPSQDASEIGTSLARAGKPGPSAARAHFAHLRMMRADSGGSLAGAPGADAERARQGLATDDGRSQATVHALGAGLGIGGFTPADGKLAPSQAALADLQLTAGVRGEVRLGLAGGAVATPGMAETPAVATIALATPEGALPQPPGQDQPPALVRGAISQRWDSAAFAPALGLRISQFLRDGVQQAQLALNPAEMGPVSLRLQLDGQTAQVHLAAERAATRDALTAALPALAAAMNEAGFTLAGGGVSDQRSADLAGERSPLQGDPGSAGTGSGNGRDSDPRQGLGRAEAELLATSLEQRAQALAQARASGRGGIDLYA